MSFLFEQALYRRCDENPDLSVLQAQWAYDRRLVADALQVIGRTFPHFSRHDASHSNTILVQLARILGPARVETLSATDLWLLLEAAYQHDIGMVVTERQAAEWLRAPEFAAHLERMRHAEDRELSEAAKLISCLPELKSHTPDWPLVVRRALTLVLADFGRQHHARNAERIVRDPVGTIGLLSPRTPLIPDRLFRILGAVCAHHGRSFDETMRLPEREAGVGTDDAHPRFVACMLRLGDLLDIDNGRFCPVMMTSFGQLPPSSVAHVEKHASILHLDIGPARIDVETECDNYASYEATEQWLGWLREELKDQMARWVEIVPASGFGALPSLGRISARLLRHIELEPGRRPRFEVEREAILNLVKGSNLYADPFSCVRELLQNGVDATILRLWREKWSRRRANLEKFEPRDLKDALRTWPIRVRIERLKSKKNEDKVRWRVSIKDSGIGISFDEIQYLQRVGGSSKNTRRLREVASMPEWMRPSGTFGIGFQSVFMCTSEVVLTTRHHESHKAYRIALRSGRDLGTDGLYIQSIEDEASLRMKIGTKVEFDIEVERLPSRFSYNTENTELEQAVSGFDFIVDNELPIDALKLKHTVMSYAKTSTCPIHVELGGMGPLDDTQSNLGESQIYFDRNTGILVRRFSVSLDSWSSLALSYRGAPVTKVKLDYQFVSMACDAYFGRASEILQLNREALTVDGERILAERIHGVVERMMPLHLSQLRKRSADDPGDPTLHKALVHASVAAYVHGFPPSIHGPEWMNWRMPGEENVRLGEIVNCPSIVIRSGQHSMSSGLPWVPMSAKLDQECVIDLRSSGGLIFDILEKTHLLSYDGTEAVDDGEPIEIYRLCMKDGHHDALPQSSVLRNVLVAFSLAPTSRSTIPCPLRYRSLAYSKAADRWLATPLVRRVWPRMLCPFVIVDDKRIGARHLGKYVKWTNNNSEDQSGEREVARALWEFLQEADELMSEAWKDKKLYSLDEAKHQLAEWLK
ncbi:HD domain-containing protein [Sorangium sp. KYC3313]|uniref:HD domain-containing protein n=1 Tax=Sorangium sp. KYC3313 TaxID=3449740 RepID=UPI003F897EA8